MTPWKAKISNLNISTSSKRRNKGAKLRTNERFNNYTRRKDLVIKAPFELPEIQETQQPSQEELDKIESSNRLRKLLREYPEIRLSDQDFSRIITARQLAVDEKKIPQDWGGEAGMHRLQEDTRYTAKVKADENIRSAKGAREQFTQGTREQGAIKIETAEEINKRITEGLYNTNKIKEEFSERTRQRTRDHIKDLGEKFRKNAKQQEEIKTKGATKRAEETTKIYEEADIKAKKRAETNYFKKLQNARDMSDVIRAGQDYAFELSAKKIELNEQDRQKAQEAFDLKQAQMRNLEEYKTEQHAKRQKQTEEHMKKTGLDQINKGRIAELREKGIIGQNYEEQILNATIDKRSKIQKLKDLMNTKANILQIPGKVSENWSKGSSKNIVKSKELYEKEKEKLIARGISEELAHEQAIYTANKWLRKKYLTDEELRLSNKLKKATTIKYKELEWKPLANKSVKKDGLGFF